MLASAVTGPRDGTYARSAALFSAVDHCDSLAIRELVLIDGAMAQLAELMGLTITDHDVSRLAPVG